LYSEYNRWIKRYVDAQDLKIIDLGCGTGLTSDLLVEKTSSSFGLDFTLPLLKRAKKRHGQKLMTAQGDITKLPFKDKSFDGIVCFDTLEHIESIEKAISEISRICRQDGLFLFDVPSSIILDFSYFFGYYGKKGLVSALRGLSQKKVMFEWESLDDNYKPRQIQTYRYRPSYFEELVKSHGFTIFEKRGVHISTMLIPEKIQANTASPLLSKINTVLRKADNFLNKISSMKNRALYILYACKMNR
jgi:ubiquinone/menaquinone biosynthesis C-methylase UbiE